ncbi:MULTISPECIES: hypothetical protein [unclassified Mesorhizobium]|uniref:hypothetical protein n=1 Tax=unclassified Mesorhizobium TaxID=325217 RepID=UPI001129462C|nr:MULTISPECIES: hypothetical protein [unclassified Mesorhizobium]TPK52899.1 hypothetical protein FJ550_14460 [Mesorhizobium sp. B2-5-2]TPL21331.1 hypothetical protein FJ946_21370 [Mesorhizobium sp. B2-4-7]TPL42944.1 hypothetical protein FJ961_09710 [Mesorhizobium sp. B2-4-5]TPM76927.1 hypothetical protein FJ968_04235 [Mesorhizobium sp. B2-1-6]TPN80041.1 hypothetical protein FJ985_02070 [Mesorhizobium sp. B1-1-2]
MSTSFITIKEFWQRLGKSKTWYTRHKQREPGFPEAVKFTDNSRPVLPLDEVEAYIARKLAERGTKTPKPKREDPPAQIKRRVGRPAGPWREIGRPAKRRRP